MRILVTGASGFLGSHIAEAFVAAGHDVRLLLRKTSNRKFLTFPFEQALGDIREPGSLRSAVEGVDAIVHAAGLIKARNEAEFAAVNELGTADLVQAALDVTPDLRRFIYVSSIAAHGPSFEGTPRPADAAPAPITAYGRTKLGGEIAVRKSPLAGRSVTFRMPAIYGPRDPALLPFFQLTRLRLAPLLDGGRNKFSIIYATDAAAAIVQSATAEADVGNRIYSPEDGRVYEWRDMLHAIEAAAGKRMWALPTPRLAYSVAALASEAFGAITRRPVVFTREKVREMSQRYWICSGDDLRRDLGWRPLIQGREGAQRTYDWYKRERWL